MKIVRFICICIVSILTTCDGFTQTPASIRTTQPGGLTIAYFGPANGFSYSNMDQTFRCVILNNSNQLIPAGEYEVKCLPITGLNYTSGNTMPTIPAIPAHTEVSTEWKLSISSNGEYPIAGAYICPVQNGSENNSLQLNDDIKLSAPTMIFSKMGFLLPVHPVTKTPLISQIDKNALQVTGNITAIQFMRATNNEYVFKLFTNINGTWQQIARGSDLTHIDAGEVGQQPWNHDFKISGVRFQNTGSCAIVKLDGFYGNLAKGTISFVISQNSSSISGEIKITALQDFQSYGVTLPQLWAQNTTSLESSVGELISINSSQYPNLSDTSIAALHTNQTTWGIIAPGAPPVSGWTIYRKSSLGQYRCALEWMSSDTGSLFQRGGSVSIPFTLFAKSGSASIQDALIFLRK